ncbi:hypothetical protein nbrc107696_23650 [Gordonia spumicola]|uniref:Lipoprotein n=1 Tax=Gordonia spumicola TaxID=589161 RepID=A0A7I9V9D2_9ACTN|nr:hypothetical protein [Gordonia spumicola]GEE01919.1 hypothetical protein nbrc107696_23650 [Gordonia spumicola]
MRIRRTALITAVCGIAAAGSVVAAAPSNAATPPELHVTWIQGVDYYGLSWDTHGRSGCSSTLVINGKTFTDPLPKPAGRTFAKGPSTYRVSCPDGTTSRVARIYGPRNPINDIRTMFNDVTGDAYGS